MRPYNKLLIGFKHQNLDLVQDDWISTVTLLIFYLKQVTYINTFINSMITIFNQLFGGIPQYYREYNKGVKRASYEPNTMPRYLITKQLHMATSFFDKGA